MSLSAMAEGRIVTIPVQRDWKSQEQHTRRRLQQQRSGQHHRTHREAIQELDAFEARTGMRTTKVGESQNAASRHSRLGARKRDEQQQKQEEDAQLEEKRWHSVPGISPPQRPSPGHPGPSPMLGHGVVTPHASPLGRKGASMDPEEVLRLHRMSSTRSFPAGGSPRAAAGPARHPQFDLPSPRYPSEGGQHGREIDNSSQDMVEQDVKSPSMGHLVPHLPLGRRGSKVGFAVSRTGTPRSSSWTAGDSIPSHQQTSSRGAPDPWSSSGLSARSSSGSRSERRGGLHSSRSGLSGEPVWMPSNSANRKPEYVSLHTHRQLVEEHPPNVQKDLVSVTTRTRMEPELTLEIHQRHWKEPRRKPKGPFRVSAQSSKTFELVDDYSVQATKRYYEKVRSLEEADREREERKRTEAILTRHELIVDSFRRKADASFLKAVERGEPHALRKLQEIQNVEDEVQALDAEGKLDQLLSPKSSRQLDRSTQLQHGRSNSYSISSLSPGSHLRNCVPGTLSDCGRPTTSGTMTSCVSKESIHAMFQKEKLQEKTVREEIADAMDSLETFDLKLSGLL